MKIEKKFSDFIRKEMKNNEISKTRLATINFYLGNKEKATELFESITNYMLSSRFDVQGLKEEDKKNTMLLINIGKGQLIKGIQFNLARRERSKALKFFEWASENCLIPEDVFNEWSSISQFDEIAVGYLWRSYALLMIGRYSEAYDLLKQVPFYFNKYKLTGCEVWQVYEPSLFKALLPLCEYKLNPVPENWEKARRGLDDFINSFSDPKFKLEALLYYYHLREMFPDVYADSSDRLAKAAMKQRHSPVADMSPEDIERKGAVVVYDPTGYLEIFGTPKDLVLFVQKVSEAGEYPLLSRLLDYYNVENSPGMDPVVLEDECVRLLERVDDVWLREKVEPLLDVAREVQREEGENIILYLDPDITLKE